MLQAVLRYASIAISAIVVLSFVMFAVDQTKSSSAKEVATVSDETSTSAAQGQQQQQAPAPKTTKSHGEPRKTIDDLDRQILKPFDGLVKSSGSNWVKKGVPSLLALVVFGFLLNLLGGYLPKPKQT